MIRLTYAKGTEVWVNPDMVRSIVHGGKAETDHAGETVDTVRIRFANEDGEIVVRGTPEEIVEQIHAWQREQVPQILQYVGDPRPPGSGPYPTFGGRFR